jgi:hypothetical protein
MRLNNRGKERIYMDKGIVLVGKAAESYVRLQWIEFYALCFFLIVVIAGLGYLTYWLHKD